MKAVINWDYNNVDIKLQKILIEFIKKKTMGEKNLPV